MFLFILVLVFATALIGVNILFLSVTGLVFYGSIRNKDGWGILISTLAVLAALFFLWRSAPGILMRVQLLPEVL